LVPPVCVVTYVRRSVGSGRFRTPVVGEVWAALESLWSSEVFLPPLTHRLFRLTLQIIGRFRLWCVTANALEL
jgi:hypothetical protein